MKPERRKELEELAKTRTEEDEQIMHILYNHIAPAFSDISIGHAEAQMMEDPRAQKLVELFDSIRGQMERVADELTSTIPGVMTKEEAVAEMEQERLKSWIDSAIKLQEEDGDVGHGE